MSRKVIDDLGGVSAVAAMCGGISAPSVSEWRERGIPAERCPYIEAGSAGKYPCEKLRPDVAWARIRDRAWRWHPLGRPVIDTGAPVLSALRAAREAEKAAA